MAYEMYLDDDGILHLTFDGDMSEADARSFVSEFKPVLAGSTEQEPLSILARRGTEGRYGPVVRKFFVELNSYPQIGRVAVARASRYGRVLGGFILKATGRENVRFFDSEAEALAWLKEGR
jgi:hypothetical protein